MNGINQLAREGCEVCGCCDSNGSRTVDLQKQSHMKVNEFFCASRSRQEMQV